MKISIKKITHITAILLVSGIIVSVSGVALSVMAAPQPPLTSVGGLVPCGNGSGAQLSNKNGTTNFYATGNTASTTACDFAGFVDLVKNVTNFLIILSAPIFVGIMIWAGIKLLLAPASQEQIKRVKQVLFDTLIAFIIILAGWLIVHVIATALFNSSFNMFQP